MFILDKKYFYILLIVLIVTPDNSIGKILGNGGDLAGPKLNKLTIKASLSTLKATEEMYKMIAFIENPEKNEKDNAKNYVEQMNLHLNKAAESLGNASKLPNQEFNKMNRWLIKRDFRYYLKMYGINENYKVWQEVIQSSGQGGGRGWLQQNIALNENLLQITNQFIKQYADKPMPNFVWELMRKWAGEINRGMYLSIILTE